MVATARYDPFGVDAMTDPLPLYAELRAAGRAHALPEYDAFALPRFDDVWRVLGDRERFSIVEGPVFHREQLLAHHHGRPPEMPPARPVGSFSMLDAPQHTRLRQAVLWPFRPGAVAALEGLVRDVAATRLEALGARGGFDVRHDYASPVSAVVAAVQLGFPVDDAETMATLTQRFVLREPGRPGLTPDGLAARDELHARIVEVVARRRRDARGTEPDALAGLLDPTGPLAALEGGPLDDHEVAAQLLTLFVGGAETLPKVVAGGAHQLWLHPEQRAALVEDPTLVGAGFEEILRYEIPLQFVGRTLVGDAEVAGVPMRAGQRLVLLLISANRDEREFADPDRFDVHRRTERHLGFGHGAHVCIGNHVARLEGTVMLETLLTRFPDYAVDDRALRREVSEFQVGWAAMPVRVGGPGPKRRTVSRDEGAARP